MSLTASWYRSYNNGFMTINNLTDTFPELELAVIFFRGTKNPEGKTPQVLFYNTNPPSLNPDAQTKEDLYTIYRTNENLSFYCRVQ